MSLQLVGGIVGGIIGAFTPIGPYAGYAIGSAIGGVADYNNQPDIIGPRLKDMTAPQLEYGWQMPRLYGTDLMVPWCAWQSNLHEVANTESAGGKGSGPTQTTFTYNTDNIYVVTELDATVNTAVLLRVWIDEKLVATYRADSPAESIIATSETPFFTSISFNTGAADQDPFPVYEAAVGVAEACAYVGVFTVFIEGLSHHAGGTKPTVKFEVSTSALGEGGDVFLQLNFTGTVGATALDDESCYDWPMSNSGMEIATANARFGSSAFNRALTIDEQTLMAASGSSVAWTQAEAITMQGWFHTTVVEGGRRCKFFDIGASGGGNLMFGIRFDGLLEIQLFEQGAVGAAFTGFGGWTHIAVDYNPDTFTLTGYVNGAPELSITYSGTPAASTLISSYRVLDLEANATLTDGLYVDVAAGEYGVDGVQMMRRARLFTGPFTPPSTAPSGGGCVYTPSPIEHNDVLRAELVRAGVPLGVLDLTATEGILLLGYTARGPARQACEHLSAIGFYEFVHEGTLQTWLRGGASEMTIPYADLGVGVDAANDKPFEMTIGGDVERARKFAFTCLNYDDDYNNLTVTDDRLVSSSAEERSISIPVVMQPPAAKGTVNTMAADAAASNPVTISISDYYVRLQLARVHTVIDHEGTSHRLRFVRETYSQGVREIECVTDDQTALQTTGVTQDNFEPNLTVVRAGAAELVLIDGPLLRDADVADPGAYAGLDITRGTSGSVQSSVDDAVFSNVGGVSQDLVAGYTTTALPNWTGGAVWDEVSTVTANVVGALSSSTRNAMQADDSINVFAIGAHGRWEFVRARTVTQLTSTQVRLSGFLRGHLGTEHAMGAHAVTDRLVLIRQSALLDVLQTPADIGVTRYFKGVASGRSGSSVPSVPVAVQSERLRPWSPSDPIVTRDASNDADISVMPRTRLASRFGGPGGSYISADPGISSWDFVIYSSSAYTTIVRTISSATPTCTYTAAQQTSDGLTPGSALHFIVYPVAAIVGRGHELRVAA